MKQQIYLQSRKILGAKPIARCLLIARLDVLEGLEAELWSAQLVEKKCNVRYKIRRIQRALVGISWYL